MTCTHIITGATGFVGSALALELLQRTNDQIVAIVRPGDSTAEDRFRAALGKAAAAYGLESVLTKGIDRCTAVAGDVLSSRCGVQAEIRGPHLQFWHSAASLRYENRHEAEIRATNVNGTRHALALATWLGVETFNYVSTAYVAGRSTGVIREELPTSMNVNNHYEHSKVEAEQLVASTPGFRTRILRPSIVVGHSRTMAATTFSGFYGFIRQLIQYRGMVDRTQEGFAARTALRMRVDADSLLNLVPIDTVVEEAVRIGQCRDAEGIFHLTNSSPSVARQVVRTLFSASRLHDPLFVESAEAFEWIDERFDQRLEFYRSYLVGDKRFCRQRTDAVLTGQPGPVVHFDEPTVQAFAGWYLERLEAERQHLPVAR